MNQRRSFWDRYTQRRISRRRALQLAAMSSGGIALAAACGGGGGTTDEKTPEATGGGPNQIINAKPADDQVVPGGIFRFVYPGGLPLGLDPQRNTSFTTDILLSGWVYSRLYMYKVEPGYDPTLFDQVPDAAESHEISDDGLTWTFKLKPNVYWHDKPPVNGRRMTSKDVEATYKRFMGLDGYTAAVYFDVLDRTIDSIEAPDDDHVVFHLKFPYAAFLNQVAAAAYLWIMAEEAVVGDADPNTPEGVIGSGPWVLKEYTPDERFRFRRHPKWHEGPDRPFLDGYDVPIIPEYATRKAQFLADQTDVFTPNANDLQEVVSRLPDCQVTSSAFLSVLDFMYFDYGINPDSPLNDEKVRRAVSMSIDREGLIDALYNLSGVRAQGYEIHSRWHSPLPSGLTKWWLDPQSEDMGDAAQWYQYDPAGAKALLAEAGLADMPAITYSYMADAYYGTAYTQCSEALVALLRDGGINVPEGSVNAAPYADYRNNIFSGDAIDGMAHGLETVYSDPDEYLWAMYHPDGVRNHSRINDPDLTKMVEDQAVEKDEDARIEIVHEIQRYVSDKMYYVPLVVYGAETFTVNQHWVTNVGVYQAASFGSATEGPSTHVGIAEDAPGRDLPL